MLSGNSPSIPLLSFSAFSKRFASSTWTEQKKKKYEKIGQIQNIINFWFQIAQTFAIFFTCFHQTFETRRQELNIQNLINVRFKLQIFSQILTNVGF